MMIRLITAGDRKLMHQLNRWAAPAWIRAWMVCASRAGDCWLWLAIALMVSIFGGIHRFQALGEAFLSVITGLALFFVLKRIAGRERPCLTETHCWASLLPPDRFSFPSGHTITAFSMAVPLGLNYPSLLIGLVFCAMSVAASRLLLGLHYLSDVAAGMAIGIGIGLASLRLGGLWL